MAEIDNVELKKRSRRRLVGAAALALLAAIVLPMVMDQEPITPVQDIQVSIPERDSDSGVVRPSTNRQTSAVEPQLAPPPEEQPPGPLPSDLPRTAVEPAPVRPAPPAIPPAKLVEPSPSRPPVKPELAAKPESHKPEPSKPEAAKPEPPKVAVQAHATHEEGVRAKDILEGKAAAAPAAAATGDAFVVQIGAFSDATKAASIATDLKKRGFAAYTEKVGAMTRVRLGPFRGRDEADRAAQRAKASGMGGTVMPR